MQHYCWRIVECRVEQADDGNVDGVGGCEAHCQHRIPGRGTSRELSASIIRSRVAALYLPYVIRGDYVLDGDVLPGWLRGIVIEERRTITVLREGVVGIQVV